MGKKINNNKEEIEAFYQAVKDIKRLKVNKIRLNDARLTKKIAKPIPKFTEESFNLNESLSLTPVQSEELISFKQAGISDKILRKLRKGQYNVDAVLDLHGMSVDEAKKAVDRFLKQCMHKEIRVVLIIHGKGRYRQMPILKNKLNHWLRNVNIVLAFCSAAPSHGSRGAMYVLLKRSLEENL